MAVTDLVGAVGTVPEEALGKGLAAFESNQRLEIQSRAEVEQPLRDPALAQAAGQIQPGLLQFVEPSAPIA